jgi:translation initiation factor IF-2
MTAFAQAALAVSDLVAAKFANLRFGGATRRLVKVQPPNVPSTGGGKQARESVVLLPENGDTSQALTAGFIDVGLRAVELRTWAALASAYEQRHKQPLDLPRSEYENFASELQRFLGGEGYVVKTIDVSDVEAKAARAARGDEHASSPGGARTAIFVGVGVVVAIAIGAAVLLLR